MVSCRAWGIYMMLFISTAFSARSFGQNPPREWLPPHTKKLITAQIDSLKTEIDQIDRTLDYPVLKEEGFRIVGRLQELPHGSHEIERTVALIRQVVRLLVSKCPKNQRKAFESELINLFYPTFETEKKSKLPSWNEVAFQYYKTDVESSNPIHPAMTAFRVMNRFGKGMPRTIYVIDQVIRKHPDRINADPVAIREVADDLIVFPFYRESLVGKIPEESVKPYLTTGALVFIFFRNHPNSIIRRESGQIFGGWDGLEDIKQALPLLRPRIWFGVIETELRRLYDPYRDVRASVKVKQVGEQTTNLLSYAEESESFTPIEEIHLTTLKAAIDIALLREDIGKLERQAEEVPEEIKNKLDDARVTILISLDDAEDLYKRAYREAIKNGNQKAAKSFFQEFRSLAQIVALVTGIAQPNRGNFDKGK